MREDEFAELRPVDGSSAAIGEAIDRVEAKREALQARVQTLRAERGAVLLHGTHREADAIEDALRAAGTLHDQLDALADALSAAISGAREAERIAELRRQWNELGYEDAVAAFVSAWRDRYATLASGIAELCQLECIPIAKLPRARQLHEALTKAGVDMPPPQHPSRAAVGGAIHMNKALSDLVMLPGPLGAPFLPTRREVQTVRRVTEMPDWDGPLISNSPTGSYGSPRPAKNKFVESDQEIIRDVPVRTDAPIWPADWRRWREVT